MITLKDLIMLNTFKEYKRTVNMNVRDLKRWDKNKSSKLIKNNNRRNIKRNIELLKTPLKNWNMKHFRWAKMIISNVKAIRKKKFKNAVRGSDLSRKMILLRNNGFNMGRKK